MQKHEEWFFIAEQDLQSACLLKDGGLFTTTLYHTQQCAEKALKGYLVYQKQPIKKTHDLVELVRECSKFDETFFSLMDAAAELKPYITQSRYPDDYVESDEADVLEAIQNASTVLEFVKSKIT